MNAELLAVGDDINARFFLVFEPLGGGALLGPPEFFALKPPTGP